MQTSTSACSDSGRVLQANMPLCAAVQVRPPQRLSWCSWQALGCAAWLTCRYVCGCPCVRACTPLRVHVCQQGRGCSLACHHVVDLIKWASMHHCSPFAASSQFPTLRVVPVPCCTALYCTGHIVMPCTVLLSGVMLITHKSSDLRNLVCHTAKKPMSFWLRTLVTPHLYCSVLSSAGQWGVPLRHPPL